MDFSFSDEQTLLQDSIEKFIQNDYAFDARQRVVREEQGFSSDNWRTFAELGWLGVPFPEADGGFGGTAIESMIMSEQFGKGLVVEPFLATVVLAGGPPGLGLAGGQPENHTENFLRPLQRHKNFFPLPSVADPQNGLASRAS